VEVVGKSPNVDSTTSFMAMLAPAVVRGSAGYQPPQPKPRPVLQPSAFTLGESTGLAKVWLLEGAQDVPSDGDAHRFRLANHVLSPTLHILVAPRLDTTAFQVVHFPAPTKAPLFPGAPILRHVATQRMGQGSFAVTPADQPYELNDGPYEGLRSSFQRVGEKRPFKMSKIVGVLTKTGGATKTETREEITTATPDRSWQLDERLTLANDTEAPLTDEVQDPVVRSAHESVRIQATPETTPGAVLRSPLVEAWTVRLEPKATASIDTGLVIKAPKEGELTGLKELGLE
jgi:hypothetical protein